MKMSDKVLFQIDSLSLKLDIVLVDYIYPVLFTCVDDYNQTYIVTCYLADANSKQWIIARSDPDKVIALLQDKLSIRDIFLNTTLWQAVLKKGELVPVITQVRIEDLDPCVLPTPGEFMDSEPNEFDSEISKLFERKRQGISMYEKICESSKFVVLIREYALSLKSNSASRNARSSKYTLQQLQTEVTYCVSV